VTSLIRIHEDVLARTTAIIESKPDWPCRKGCDDCCRHLASQPLVSREEWLLIDAAIATLPPDAADAARRRIRASDNSTVCPLLDTGAGACLIYDARPVACRSYGFYAERELVLGCHRILAISEETPDILWGNHLALDEQLRAFGEARPLAAWL